MSALNAALCRRGIILWLAAVLLLASRSTHSAPVYDQDTTHIAEYDGATIGCYFNFQRYQEGDRIMTSEPCLNCTCHNRMLMCYLKVCPFTKAIGQDCTVEKRPDQCCPVITCPQVPVQLLTSTTSAPATSDSTEVGFHDNYGCHVDERFYADGAMLPLDHHNPCELCYCIRNRTTCVMQECTLQVAGCKPVYQPGVCCPIKYNCEYDEESSTTVGTTPGLIVTTTLSPGVLPQCYYKDKVYEDGDLIYSTQPCQHCYCFRGEIACAVQDCGTPMQEHGKNCTALPPPEGKCCPTTYQCEEGLTTVYEGEEQYPQQVLRDHMTESPMLIDQEDQQHSQEETFPDIDKVTSHAQGTEEEEGTIGTIEQITQGHILSTEKPEEQPTTTLSAEEIETTTVEKESTPSHEHVTETSPVEVTSEKAGAPEAASEAEAAKTETPTTVQGAEEGLVTEAPITELPETSSVVKGLQPEEEVVTTEHVSEEHISTEESVIEKEHGTPATAEKEESTELSISEVTEGPVKEEESTSPHEGLPTQTLEEEKTEVEKTTEEEQITVTKAPERPEISTEIVEKATSPAEEPDISTESVTEQSKESESKLETIPDKTLATETESPKEEETVTVAHEISSTEQIVTEKEEVSHPTEAAVTEEVQSTSEVSGPPQEQPIEKEQKPVTGESEKEQRPEEPTSEHAVIKEEQATVGAKKEDAGLTESPAEEESTPEIPTQGPTGIPIPEQSPKQKAEDESVYHVTEDYHGITRPEVSPDNLITEPPQKIPTTHLPQEETTLVSSEETVKPIATEGPEILIEGTAKPIPEEATEINLPSQSKPEITTSSKETEMESTPAITEVQASTESSATTVAHEKVSEEEVPEKTEKSSVPEETGTEVPQTEVQSTEKIPSGEEMPTKELDVEESSERPSEISSEKGEKEMKNQSSEEEIETQPPVATEPETASETLAFIPMEHLTVPSVLGEEHATEGEHVTTVITSAEQSTHVPEKEIEIVPVEKEKPVEEHATEQSTATTSVTVEEGKELQTEEPVLEEKQTTEMIKTIEDEEKPTTWVPTVEEGITEQPEQYSTQKAAEEAAVTESYGLKETEGTKGASTESAEQQTETTITEKEPSKETVELQPTEVIGIEQTELPAEHPIETGEIEKEGEEKIPVSTEKVQTETPAIETGVIETTTVEKETEKVQTEPSVSGEYIPSQSSIPSDRKEDQEPIEPEINEEQMTQKPSLGENEVTETYEESQKPIISSEEETSYVSPTEEAVTESSPPEEKPVEIGTTEVAGIGETVTQPEPEIASEQPEKVTTEQLEQEEETQRPITEQQPEIHERKETETPSSVTHEQPSVTPVPQKPVEGTESESTTIPVLISEASTKLPEPVEESTKEHEGKIPIENEIIPSTEFVPSEEEQSTTHEQATQPSVTEEKPTEENIEKEIISSTEFVPSEEEQSTTHEQATQPSVTEEKPTEENIEKEIIPSTEFVPSEEEQPKTHEQSTQPSVTEEKPTGENIEKEIIPSTEFVPSEDEQPKIHEQATQPSVTEEKPTDENIEKEIISSTEFVPSEDEQPKIHEQATQPSVTEEKPTDENIEKEIISSTEFVPSEEEQSTTHEQATQPSVTEEKPTEENIEKEIIPSTEFIPSEEEQPKTHEQATQPSVTEEKPTGEKSEAEGPTKISTEEDITPETPKVSITEEQSQKPDEEEIAKEMTTETPIHEEQEEYSTISLPETPEVKITTEISPKEVPQYSTETIPEEISVEEESKSEIVPRPSGIPGEGNCLVEGQSYSNNSAVPPANACQVSCRCISSIVQCELVQCPAPPAHLSNCMPVHTSGESCCPMYACDSAPTDELESESHVIEPHPEEEDQKNVPPMEISTEVEKESSTLVGEMSTPESRPAEVTILPSEEEITTETQQTTLKPIETVYEQPSTVGQPEEHPEEHTISPVPETSQESTSQVLEEEHTVSPVVSGETTEGKISEEGESITELASTEQPKEEIAEKQTPVSGEIITSTHAPVEQELYSTEEGVTVSTVTEKEETSTPVKVEEASIPAETEEEVTIAVDKKDEITPIKEQEKPTEEGVEKQSTLKPVEEIEKEQPEEEKVSTEAISEEPVTAAEHETSTKLEEIVTEKPEILEEQKTVKPTEYEGTSVPEIQSTTEHKPESETGYKEEIEQEAVTLTEAAQTEEPESQTKLPGIAPSEVETQEPITPAAESTTLIPDHTGVEKAPKEEYTTVKSMEESTKTEPEISTQAPATEEEHVTVPVLSVEAETATEETPVEESIPEVSHEETSPESTERAIEKETTEHVEEHTEPSITEHEEKPSVTKSPEEKPSETESPISTEEPVKTIEVEKTTEAEAEYGKPTETSITQQPESTQISVEEHPEATPEIESHTSELPAEEHTVAEEVSTTSAPAEKEAGEQPTTPIAKETEPSLSEAGQPIVPEVVSETPAAEKEHVTVSDEEQTTKSEEHPVEEQTVASTASSEEEKIESGVSTEEATSITSQEEQATEKTVESAKPETELPGLAEEHTIIPVVVYEEEKKQKPEVGITEEPSKEVSAMVPEVTEAGEKETTEEAVKDEAVTSASATEEHPSMTEHTEQKEVEPFVKVHEPMEFETTIAPKEQEPEEESQVTEASLPKHPVSEEATTILIPEEPIVTVKTEEKEETHEQTTLSAAEEVSKPATEASEVEKPEEEVTIAETERPEEPVTRVEVSSTENAEEVPSETERPVEPEQETESPEQQQDETTTKAIESVVTEGELLEVVPVEVTPEAGEKPTEASAIGEEEEAHSTEPSVSVETTSVHEEEQPSITKLQPTEGPLPSEEETQSSQPEGEETHPAVPEESYPGVAEEPQFTTEHAPETSVTIKTEEYPETEKPETSSEAAAPVEGPIKVSGVPTELLEETSTVGPVLPEESESQIPIKSEEVPQPETPVEEPIIKTQPIPTELPTGQITEEIPEDEIHPQEEEKIDQPHIDHFATMKPETNYSAGDELTPGTDDKHLQPAPATLAPDIPEYPGQSGSDEYNPDFPVNGGSFLSPGSDYYGDDLEPGACRYSGKIYVSAQQIPRDDPCDFCFCFRSDIICLQQSCPPPIPGCHEEPISGFCCPRYECPVSMATALNLTTTTTTTTTTLPPHFHAHAYKGAARRSGCQVRGQAYRVGEVIKSASGPCLRCICGGDGNMNCNPRVCSPEPMLKQMIAATTEAKRRR